MGVQISKSPDFDFKDLAKRLNKSSNQQELFDAIVNAPFEYEMACADIRLGIMTLLMVNPRSQTLDRIALTKNQLAEYTKRVSVKRFEDIKIPLSNKQNLTLQAIASGEPKQTSDWKDIFVPELSPDEARMNQASGGLATTFVYPLMGVGDGAAIHYSYYQYPENVGQAQHQFMEQYSNIAAHGLITKGL